MKLLDEIRSQPLHIRKVFMWTLVVVSFIVVGLFWFQGAQQNVVALLGNAQPGADQSAPSDNVASPFALIGGSWAGLRADISGLFSARGSASDAARHQPEQPAIAPQALPVQ